MKAKLRLLLLAPVVAGALTIVLAGTGVPAASACVPPNCPVIKAPIVSTSAATGVTSSTATLNGTVNPNGTTATCVFEYGPTAGYGYRTSNQTVAPSQTKPTQSLTAALVGIEAGRAFHYQLTCANSAGTGNGGDASFSTPSTAQKPLPAVVRLSGHIGFVSTTGMAGVLLGCYGSSPGCSGSLILTHAGKVVGRRSSYVMPAESGAIVHVQLSPSARRALRKTGQLGVLVASSLRDGTRLTGNRKVTLHLFR